MLLLVGLGNPGKASQANRHNIGFMAVDEIHRRFKFSPWRRKFQGLLADGEIDGERVHLLKPQTYMNESGRSVAEAVRFFKVPRTELARRMVVFHDELDLAPGKVRVKTGGGLAGHNGLRSIDSHLGPEFRRIRIGIGHPGSKDRVTGHVLRDFSKQDIAWVEKVTDAIAEATPLLVAGKDEDFMTKVALLTQPPKPKKPAPADKPDAGDHES
jgi:PTH1 family peptidyl-tRNA hydrolase